MSENERSQETRIWIAFCAAVVVYGAVLRFLFRGAEAPLDIGLQRPLLYAGALVSVCGTLWWGRRGTARPKLQSGSVVPDGPAIASEVRAEAIITWAWAETVAVFGLVLSFLSRDADAYLPFAAVSFVLLFLYRPAARQSAGTRPGG
jgi:hypothetical protein